MTFKNIFGNGESEARSAEEAARHVHEKIPGARPEREGVDPELFDGITEVERDPKIIRETSPEALSIMNNFITPLFKNTQTASAEQRVASENPESTSGMASAAKDASFTKVQVEIEEDDRPEISEEEREELSRESYGSAKKRQRTDGGSTEGWGPIL